MGKNLDNFAICGWIFTKFSAYVHIDLLIGLLKVMGLESDCGSTCEQFYELTSVIHELDKFIKKQIKMSKNPLVLS